MTRALRVPGGQSPAAFLCLAFCDFPVIPIFPFDLSALLKKSARNFTSDLETALSKQAKNTSYLQ